MTHVDRGRLISNDGASLNSARREPAAFIELQTAASTIALATIRTVAADLAARADFDLDSIDDLRMAVDDVCAMLVPIAAPHAVLSCTFTIWSERIELVAEVDTAASADSLPTGSLRWRVLEALTDDVIVLFRPGNESRCGRACITLIKNSMIAPP